ncbi:hypothetical protein, partial [Klebsiella pneumoniae]|uniref:hypothetical protein n=1 Tax=Klebsiella pneumoniae TaxID=573 RepID=UPI001954762E
AISSLGFPMAAALIGLVTVAVMWVLADLLFRQTPESLGVEPDGDVVGAARAMMTAPHARPLAGSALWRDRGFITLSAGMALGLFA